MAAYDEPESDYARRCREERAEETRSKRRYRGTVDWGEPKQAADGYTWSHDFGAADRTAYQRASQATNAPSREAETDAVAVALTSSREP